MYSFTNSFIQRIFMKHLSNSSYTLSIVPCGIRLFYGNSYNQYFDAKEIMKNLKYFSDFSFQYFMLRETHYLYIYLSDYLILNKIYTFKILKNQSQVYCNMYLHIYKYVCVCVCVYIYIYIYT